MNPALINAHRLYSSAEHGEPMWFALRNALKRVAEAKQLSPAQKAQIFHGTAARVYALPPVSAPKM